MLNLSYHNARRVYESSSCRKWRQFVNPTKSTEKTTTRTKWRLFWLKKKHIHKKTSFPSLLSYPCHEIHNVIYVVWKLSHILGGIHLLLSLTFWFTTWVSMSLFIWAHIISHNVTGIPLTMQGTYLNELRNLLTSSTHSWWLLEIVPWKNISINVNLGSRNLKFAFL